MSAGAYDLTVEQNADLSRVFTYRDSGGQLVNLTGYTASMHVRQESGTGLLIDLTSSLTLGGALGTITLFADKALFASVKPGRYKYDLLLESAGGVSTRLLAGSFDLVGGITA